MNELLLNVLGRRVYKPVLWLDPSDEQVGSTNIVDKSERLVPVTNMGVTVSDDAPLVGMKSMQFTGGAYKYLRLPFGRMPNLLEGSFTIEYWAKVETNQGNRSIFGQWQQSVFQGGILCAIAAGNACQFHFGAASENGALLSNQVYSVNAWQHVAWVRTGTTWIQYINGRQVGTTQYAGSRAQLSIDWFLGTYLNGSAQPNPTGNTPFVGKIADLRVYEGPVYTSNFDPITGDEYLGTLSEAEVISGTSLAAQLGLTKGNNIARPTEWLKFVVKGRTILVAKKPVRYNVTWQMLEDAGAIDGSTKVVIANGDTYRIRLMEGAEKNPSEWIAAYGQNDPGIVAASEYNRTLYKVHESSGQFEKFTDTDLGIQAGANGRMTICKEKFAASALSGSCVARSNSGLKNFNYPDFNPPAINVITHYGWRPVLEFEKAAPVDGPGPKDIIVGDETDGYYGTLTADEFFTGDELAIAVKTETSGFTINNNTDWVKVILDGKIIYMPKLPIRWGLPYDHLFGLGVIGNETTPKVVEKFGKRFHVRLMTGTNPGTTPVPEEFPTTSADRSEFNRIIYRLTNSAPVTDMGLKFADFTLLELGLQPERGGGSPYQRIICQEAVSPTECVMRNGNNGIFPGAMDQWMSLQIVSRATQNQMNVWRPVLELLGDA
uniref:Virion structural protein n=1 Tax=Pseudomonas phage RVTF4 TaxID=3236931 RepID=A0AB39CCF3_9VIRU